MPARCPFSPQLAAAVLVYRKLGDTLAFEARLVRVYLIGRKEDQSSFLRHCFCKIRGGQDIRSLRTFGVLLTPFDIRPGRSMDNHVGTHFVKVAGDQAGVGQVDHYVSIPSRHPGNFA
ncbi:MAG: hypothetical protein RID42_07475 [Alphaproteobacteria bacterium]